MTTLPTAVFFGLDAEAALLCPFISKIDSAVWPQTVPNVFAKKQSNMAQNVFVAENAPQNLATRFFIHGDEAEGQGLT